MAIGLSTYSFFWQWHETSDEPMTLHEMLSLTARWGAQVFQICDYPPIETLTPDEVDEIYAHARDLGLTLELGTRGVSADQLRRYLVLAQSLSVTLVRSMVTREEIDRAVTELASVIGDFEAAGVSLALETYEQIPTARLVEIVDQVGSENLGICLDPGNCVAALETPRQTIDLVSGRVKNLHVKDFAFSRQAGWVGFTYAGTKLGDGLLDLDYLMASVRPNARGVNQIIEHWLVWQGDSASTRRLELEWTRANLNILTNRITP